MSDRYQSTVCEDLTIEFIKRSSQKNLRIRVKNNQVIVSGPISCRKKTMHDFLNQNWNWVENVLHKQSLRSQALVHARKKYENHIMYHGKWLPLQQKLARPSEKKWHFDISEGILWFTPPAGESGRVPDSEILNEYLKELAKPQILDRFNRFAPKLPFKYNRVFIRSQKTKWGTCSGKANLSFNWRLIKCPFWIWDYLFIHELCHTIHFNHSKEYWRLVDKHFPQRKEAEAWIRQYGDVVFRI